MSELGWYSSVHLQSMASSDSLLFSYYYYLDDPTDGDGDEGDVSESLPSRPLVCRLERFDTACNTWKNLKSYKLGFGLLDVPDLRIVTCNSSFFSIRVKVEYFSAQTIFEECWQLQVTICAKWFQTKFMNTMFGEAINTLSKTRSKRCRIAASASSFVWVNFSKKSPFYSWKSLQLTAKLKVN